MPTESNTSPNSSSKADRRKLLALLAALDSEPRWKIIGALRQTRGKTIQAIASVLGGAHSAASEHARILRSVGILKSVLADEDDLRTVYQILNEEIIVTDEAGVQWLDFGVLKVRLD